VCGSQLASITNWRLRVDWDFIYIKIGSQAIRFGAHLFQWLNPGKIFRVLCSRASGVPLAPISKCVDCPDSVSRYTIR
jgi:hypothetical protein